MNKQSKIGLRFHKEQNTIKMLGKKMDSCTYSPHIPTAYIDLDNICHNYNTMQKHSVKGTASEDAPYAKIPQLAASFGSFTENDLWPEQMAVVKADAYGHDHIAVTRALMQNKNVRMFASGGVQEACMLRAGIEDLPNKPLILSLLGFVNQAELNDCLKYGIVPVVHSFEQLAMLESLETDSGDTCLPIAVKCNTGMARLGFNQDQLPEAIKKLQNLSKVKPIITLTHMHSADTERVLEELQTQGQRFAKMLAALRSVWPNMAASLANSAATLFAHEIAEIIGPHICRPGISLYGANPFHGTSWASRENDFLPTMWLRTPIITHRTLAAGEGISYGHVFVAQKDMPVGVLACGYADGFTRSLTGKGKVCVDGIKVPLIGRVAMQMIYADLSTVPVQKKQPQYAWLLGGPYEACVNVYELSETWNTIPHEAFCLLGYNKREFISFSDRK